MFLPCGTVAYILHHEEPVLNVLTPVLNLLPWHCDLNLASWGTGPKSSPQGIIIPVSLAQARQIDELTIAGFEVFQQI